MTKKTQPPPDSSAVFERALDAATTDSTPASDITEQLAAEGLELLGIGFPEASDLMFKARDEIERLRGRGWLPIESAPTDGSVVMLWHGGPYLAVGWYDSGKKLWQEVWTHEWTYPSQPTAWQPRPSDPAK